MSSTAPQELKASELYSRLQSEQQVVKDFWVHIDSSSPLEKYPAKQHAQRVAQKLGVAQGLIYLPGTPTEYEEDSDQPKPFRQRRYFYYLSGVNETDCHLVYDINEDTLTLFIPKIDPQTVIWNGRGSTRAEALEKYDVDEVLFTTSVPDFVRKWPISHEGEIYILHPDQAAILGFHGQHPRIDYQKLQLAINSARMIKDSHEINLIRKANEVTAKAHREVLLNILKFKNESQVEAIFLDACVAEGAKHQAYEPIAASGVNASTLHYIKNDEPLEDRQLMCLDAGCEWECYASDVTRSFPLSGSWPSTEAKQIHDLVQTMQDCCIKRLGPGVRYLDLHILAHQIAIGGLLALGILHNGSPEEIYRAGTSRAFFPHGLGHHIGLEVHDIGQRELMSACDGGGSTTGNAQMESKHSPNYHLPVYHAGLCLSPTDPQSPALEEGMIVTVEPGIYFSLYALETLYLPSPVHSKYINKDVLYRYLPVGGVRIEDDILITASGYQNLTTAPKGEEMLDIIRSQAKCTVSDKEASITTSTNTVVLPKFAPKSLVEPSSSSPLVDVDPVAPTVRPASRSKRISSACMYCRRRKVQCSGPNSADPWNRCSNCVRFGLECCIRPIESIPELGSRITKIPSQPCHYCLSRMLKCRPSESPDERCHWCVTDWNAVCTTKGATYAQIENQLPKIRKPSKDMELSKSVSLLADFEVPAIAPFRPQDTNPIATPAASLSSQENVHRATLQLSTNQETPMGPRIARLLGSEQPTSSWEESLQQSIFSAHPKAGCWDGMDALGFAEECDTSPAPKPPQVPQKPLAYRHNVPCLTENSDYTTGCSARTLQESPNSTQPLGDSPSPLRATPPSRSRPIFISQTSATSQERLSKLQDHLFRPKEVPETWGNMRTRMDRDPPAVPQWLCLELEQLRQTYPGSNIVPVMMFSAIDAKSSVVLQLKSDLPAPTHPGVLYTYLPRICCKDCPGKLYTPPMANFEIHLKNRYHKAAVAKNRPVEMGLRSE